MVADQDQRQEREMDEVQPGIFHWSAFHEGIRQRVSSYYVEGAAAAIDPMLPPDGLEWFSSRPLERILLTNRHHYRHSDDFQERYGCPVFCNREGLHEFENGPPVEGFSIGVEVAPAIVTREVGAICPDDTALHVTVGDGVLAFGDGLIRSGDGSLGFVSDFLLGDDPEAVRHGLTDALRNLLELDFDTLLFAHGEPLAGGGKTALRRFLELIPV
jgi:hypothetical protein